MNQLTIIGNLTENPQSRVMDTGSGTNTVCNFTVATNRMVKGEKRATFFRVSCWNRQAENAMKYLSKGRKVAVTGPVEASAWVGQDGQARARLEVFAESIEYLGGKPDERAQSEVPDDFVPVDDDEMPF